MSTSIESDVPATGVEEFGIACATWLDGRVPRRTDDMCGDRRYAIFHNHSTDDERALIHAARRWQAEKVDDGFGALAWSPEWGGSGLSAGHERVYADIERRYAVPERHEIVLVTVDLVAPTVHLLGTDAQRERLIRPFLRADELCCQLFSEPGAGSDLAGVTTRARRDGDRWIINGQKVWSSGAQFAEWGLLIARSDPTAAKHAGLTAFLVPMDTPGVDVRPIRQMSGGSTFNEVFLDDVIVPDALRLGDEGQGWSVALTTLGFERNSSAGIVDAGANGTDLVRLVKRQGLTHDPLVRQRVGEVAAYERALTVLNARYAERRRAGAAPGVEGSVGKIVWTQNLTRIGEAAVQVLGPLLAADSGEHDTYAWSEHLLGAPGYRIAGGSDEIQRNIIGERGLGLPREPR